MSQREHRDGGAPETTYAPTSATVAGTDTPTTLYTAGLAHLRAGRKLDAQIYCQQSLAIDPNHSDTLHLMGLLCLDANQHDHAIEWIARAIQQVAKAEYLTSFGTALQQQGRLEDALKAFDKAVQLNPEVGELWKNLGNILFDLKRPDDALLSFQHALKLTPRLWHAAHQCAVLLYNTGRFEEALPLLDECAEQQPGHVPSLQLRALSLKGLKRYEEALAQNLRAYAVDPGNADTCNNIGDVLHLLDRHDEALLWFDRAIAAQPGYILPVNNKAFLLGQMHRFDEAIAIYEGLQRDGINTPMTDWNLSLFHMMTGNFEAGWRGREARWKANVLAVTYPHFEQKMWLGEGSIDGKTVLIHADEGLGDCIQFARYIPEVAALGARVLLAVAEPIRALLSGLPGVSECLPLPGGPLPSFDFHIPLSSLPLAFKTRLDTIPAAASYLPPPPEDRVRIWESRLGPHDKLRVGLVWSGNPAHGNDRNRSTSLGALSYLFDLDATFVSLQKNPKASDQEVLRKCPEIIDPTADLSDFSETAALVSCLDLVITVDTSVAHLAPALGCPTWILLPYTPDYRWLLDREDSPWYPTARLFRQSERRDYREVLEHVRRELTVLISQRQASDQVSPGTSGDATPEDLSRLGIALHQAGRHAEALDTFDRALRFAPGNAELWKDRGNVLIDLQRPADAILSFERTVRLSPHHWDAAYRCGFLLHQLERNTEAIFYFDLVDRLQPNQAAVLEMRAAVLHRLKRFDEALADNQRAHALNPGNANTCNNIGAALQVLGRDGEALPWFERALKIRPDYIEALTNKAAALQQLHRFDEAVATYSQVKAIDSDDAETDWNLSLLQLLTGNFEDGWRGREARWNARRAETSLAFAGPRWRGEDIAGKTILIYMDEGLGDAIQFARYVPRVAERGARVILLVLPAVYPLLSNLPGVAQCIPFSATATPPAFDLHCPMSSLPLMFRTRLDTIPSPQSYLPPLPQARVQAWEDRLGRHDKLRVGFVWAGNPDHKNDHNRSLSLRMMSRLFDLDATFVSLQKDLGPEDRATLGEHIGIIDLTADLSDFSETAALVSCLDLVITVDTSVAHLAPALGRPTWILLPYTPDYRWLLGRDDSPWYPTARLFRQSARRDYGEVLDRVRSALIRLICERQTIDRPSDALLDLQRALKLDPGDWDAAIKCGIALHKMGRFQEAHAYFDLCNELQPDHATTLYMRGRALLDLGRLEEALVDCQRAQELDPLNSEICNSIGAILRAQGHEEQALPWFDGAIRLQPNSVPALTNRAVCLGQMQRFDEAFAAYALVKTHDPDNAQATWNAALLQLLTGNFEDGWAGREARWNIAARPIYPAFSQPMWLGKEPVDGKTIVICADEGLGDIIHFARYAPMLAARGARVQLVVDPPAVSLLSGLPGVSGCFSKAGAALPAIDMHCPMSSLPLAFGTRLDTIPAETAYLPSPPAARVQAWEQRLGKLEKSRDRLRVGLVWSGNPRHQNDHNRSIQLHALSRILDAEASFVSLQKDPRPADRAMLLERPDIIDLTTDLHDFSETAALIKCLDLVVTVDTSVAHLAAALGCPTWILLPYTPDYRWLLDREDSPWYPTARLFRQSARRDYGEVLDRVRDELAALITQHQATRRASAAIQATPTALHETGMAYRRGGRQDDARLCCEQALAADSSHAGALHLMGLLSLDAGQHDSALDWISSAIRQDPRPEYLASLGITLQQAKRHEEALNVFDKAVQLKPDDAALWSNLGDALMELQRKDEALLSFQHSLSLAPFDWNVAYKSLFLLHALGRLEAALTHFDRYEGLADHVPALQLRALSLSGLQRFEESLTVNLRAIELDPTNADISNNLGDALQSLGRREEALQWFARAIELRPGLIQALKNKAFVLTQLHRFAEAIAAYQRVLALDPANAAAECDLAQLHLLTGNFEAGWAEREARWNLTTTYPEFSQPMWIGREPIKGKTLLVYADEGMGDSIQFARYIPELTQRGARIILAVEAPVVPLLSELPGIAQCIAKPLHTPPAHDMHCPMCSLPLAFGTRLDSIPSATYLPKPPGARVRTWEERLGSHGKMRIGLIWSGNPLHGNDHNRSIPLRLLVPLLDTDATFVSLQRDPRPEDRTVLSERTDIIDFTADLTDFSETAALMSCLDLVITVDTGAAHLSAALGRPTWILLPYTPDYRWLLDRDDSPWYPTVRLFRQTESREYASVLDRVRRELQKLALELSRRETRTIDRVSQADLAKLASLCEAGLSHFLAEQYFDARLCCQQALDMDSDYADALHLMGLLSAQTQQYDRAVEWIARAVQRDPKRDYLSNLGTMLLRLGRHEEARETLDRATQLNPADAELWTNLGNVLVAQKRPADAVLAFQQALKLNPHDWSVASRSGFHLYEMGRFEEALEHFNLCDELQPNHASVLQLRGLSSRGLRRFEAYLEDSRRSYALDPNSAETRNNIGDALQLLGRCEEALTWFDQATELQPHFVAAFTNKASALQQLHRFDDAFAIYRHLKVIAPDNVTADWNLSLLQLLTGNFEAGWARRETRWNLAATAYPTFSQPMWLGNEPVEGKTIMVYADEGMEDSIQYVRYVPILAARGARVIMVEAKAVIPLLSGLPGITICVPRSSNAALPAFDMHCPITNLPLAFQTRLETIPSQTSYLPAPSAPRLRAWEKRLGPHDKLRVGLVWSGNPRHHNDQNRSMQLRTLARILDVEATFVSLQKDPRPADETTLLELPAIIDLTADLHDFGETAALVSCLDLVITVDTSVAHLSAALGRPTWVLLPYTPDYRWLLDRDDSPWYPTVRLFRQTESREYASVLDRVRDELQILISARKLSGSDE